LLYSRDQKIKTLENRLSRIGDNLENVIDARLFEKGNQLIYELDSANRVLHLFKQSIYDMERNLVSRVQGEQLEKFDRMKNEHGLKDTKFDKYKETILNMINADFAEDMERIKKIIKTKAENAKNTDRDAAIHKSVRMYNATGLVPNQANEKNSHAFPSNFTSGAVVPDGFEHYSFCTCYKVNPDHPQPTLELANAEMLTEREARRELQRMCTLLRK
jgi:hypothetical protein